MTRNELSEVAVEMNSIFDNMSDELLIKIPKKLKDFLKEIASQTYEFEYDSTKELIEQNIKPGTKGILAIIYKEYICNEDEKKEYVYKYKKFLQEQEAEKRKKYNPDALFKNKVEKNIEYTEKEVLPIVNEKKSLLKKIINKIKSIIK